MTSTITAEPRDDVAPNDVFAAIFHAVPSPAREIHRHARHRTARELATRTVLRRARHAAARRAFNVAIRTVFIDAARAIALGLCRDTVERAREAIEREAAGTFAQNCSTAAQSANVRSRCRISVAPPASGSSTACGNDRLTT
jgi:hypothetical protein